MQRCALGSTLKHSKCGLVEKQKATQLYIWNSELQSFLETEVTLVLTCDVISYIPRGKLKYPKQNMHYLLICIISHLSGEQIKRAK